MLPETLAKATADRQVIAFDYDDKPRVLEPHAVGINAKGALQVRGFQTNAEPPTWKLFTVEKITNLTVTDLPSLAPRPGYKAGDRAMVNILAQLPEPAPVAEAA